MPVELTQETRLQITETGKRRLKRIEEHHVLRSLIEQSPIGSAVLSILGSMENGEVMTVKQLIDLRDQEHKPEDGSVANPVGMFAGRKTSRLVSFRAIKRCIRKGYLMVTLIVNG